MDIAIVFMRCWTSGEKSMSVNLAATVESTETESVLLIHAAHSPSLMRAYASNAELKRAYR